MAPKQRIQHSRRERQRTFDNRLKGVLSQTSQREQLFLLHDVKPNTPIEFIPLRKIGSWRRMVMIRPTLIENYELAALLRIFYRIIEMSFVGVLIMFALLNDPGYFMTSTWLPVASGETTTPINDEKTQCTCLYARKSVVVDSRALTRFYHVQLS